MTKSRSFWPAQVRRLIDAGWTVEDVARALQNTPERVRQYITGRAIPDLTDQRVLLRLLTLYVHRRAVQGKPSLPPPRLVEENVEENHVLRSGPEPKPARGVYEEEIAPSDECWYKIVLSNGRVGTIHLPDELVDPQFKENLWRRLDAKDPVKTLKAI